MEDGNKSTKFYFANLGADVARCIRAAKDNNELRYERSLARAYQTLDYLHKARCHTSYEEGLLMLRGLALARADGRLNIYESRVNSIVASCYTQT